MKQKSALSMVMVLFFCTVIFSQALAAKSYNAERYDVIVRIQPDGVLYITETIDTHFAGGSFSYFFRNLNLTNLDRIDSFQASMDREILPPGTQAGQVEIKDGNPIKVIWHFTATRDNHHEFTLTYQVHGAIRKNPAADTLIWIGIPADHDYQISSSKIVIEYPPGIHPVSTPTLFGVPATVIISENAAEFIMQQIDSDTPVEISASFPAGSLVSTPPYWQSLQDERNNRIRMGLPYFLSAALICGIFVLVVIIISQKNLRQKYLNVGPENSQFSIIFDATPPAMAARLAGGGTPYLGTLFDLAQRRFLNIQEGAKKWGSHRYEIVRLSNTFLLHAHEQVFLEVLFGKTKSDRVALSDIGGISSNSKYNQAIDQELTTAGLLEPHRVHLRSRFLSAIGLGLIFGIILIGSSLLFGALIQATGLWVTRFYATLMGVGVGISVACLIGLPIVMSLSVLSDEGVRRSLAWKKFADHLRNITQGKDEEAAPDDFDRYLPYAAGFGIATEWAKHFEERVHTPVPDWFQSLQPGIDDGSFVAFMAAIIAVDSSSASATGGGEGASGGGASGAG
jgi:hypothetical protein